jgi:dipeptidase D
MSRLWEGCKPERVLYYFEEISKIPRCSGKEKQVSDYLVNWAKSKNLKVYQDQYHNVVIYKDGTKGYENAPKVVLQGHMDMVCEKNEDTVHDFDKDPIKLVIKDDYIHAEGTTLGADNGIAVAMNLTILESNDIPHPPIEVLITSDEETGMTGAMNIDPSVIEGRILLNLDSEGEGIFTSGCAGGGRINFVSEIEKKESKYSKKYRISIKGLMGGHSGVEIHLDRANASKLMGRLLYKLKNITDLENVQGGSADNAIPREAFAVVTADDLGKVKSIVENLEKTFKNEYAFSDVGISIEIQELIEEIGEVFSDEFFDRYLKLINLIPYGPLKINRDIDLVIQSNNPGVVKVDDEVLIIKCAVRSSIESLKDDFCEQMIQLGEATGFKVEKKAFYPGWEYAKESYIRDLCSVVYKEEYGTEAEVMAIHAGLECGFFIEKIPEMDAVSFGPEMYDIHTPGEHLSISSTERTFNLLKSILKKIK